MDQSVSERLSRLIDGDLDADEIRELEEEIASGPAVRRELEGLQRVRASLQSLADRESPPDALDVLVDPLLLGKPERISSRGWVRWLATAAVVVLGVTVVLEFQRRQPESTALNWQERALEGVGAEPTKRFALAPLPTSAAPESRPVGASERLLAAPEPEIDSEIDPPPALEVLGPLDSEEMESRKVGTGGGPRTLQSETQEEDDGRSVEAGDASSPDDYPAATAHSKLDSPATGATTAAPEVKTEKAARQKRLPAADPASAGGHLFVFMEADTAWKSFQPQDPSEAGRYALRIKIKGGRVLKVWPVANPPATTRQVRASQLVLGLEVDGVPDGEYAAEVVVESRDPPVR